MPHTLPDLPYAHDALEPHIDTRTMQIHHGKHHAGLRTAKLNGALEGHADLHGPSLCRGAAEPTWAALPADIRRGGAEQRWGLREPQRSSGTIMTPGGGRCAFER